MIGWAEFDLLEGGQISVLASAVCAVSDEDDGASIFFGDARVVSVKQPRRAVLARMESST